MIRLYKMFVPFWFWAGTGVEFRDEKVRQAVHFACSIRGQECPTRQCAANHPCAGGSPWVHENRSESGVIA